MKQKVVIGLHMEDAKKRAKAMKKAVGIPGVLSAAIEGADKNQIVVIGEGVDSVALTTALRKLMGCADLISVAAVPEKKPEAKESEAKKPEVTVQPMPAVWPSYVVPQNYYYVPEPVYHQHQEPADCSIM